MSWGESIMRLFALFISGFVVSLWGFIAFVLDVVVV